MRAVHLMTVDMECMKWGGDDDDMTRQPAVVVDTPITGVKTGTSHRSQQGLLSSPMELGSYVSLHGLHVQSSHSG